VRVLRASDVQASAVDPRVADACAQVSEERLEQGVRALAFPRSLAETAHNQRAAAWIEEQLRGLGLHVERQGALENVVARPPGLAGACSASRSPWDWSA
jgi:acetylornithine deacetylase/succinyl-diaminopimelate desuccinylase-like protein